MKYFDSQQVGNAIGIGTTEQQNLNIVVQGDGEQERIGRRITIRSIQINGDVNVDNYNDASATVNTIANHVHYRIMILLDTQCNGANPTIQANDGTGLLLADATTAMNSWYNFRDPTNKGRYKILKQWRATLVPQSALWDSTTNVVHATYRTFPFSWYKRVNITIQYDSSATTGAVTTQRSNALWFVIVNANRSGYYNYRARIRFTD